MLFETATCAVAFPQAAAAPDTTSRVSLGVLIDTSAHQKEVIDFQRNVIRSVADGFGGLATESFVLRYADEIETLQDWSPLKPGLEDASKRIELDVESGQNRRTLLYDAVDAALKKFETSNKANSKVLVIIAEGNDAGSAAKYTEVKKRAIAARIQCFVLLVASHNLMGGRMRHFGYYLYDLASATKGKAYDVERSKKNLDKAIRDVLKRVR
ncbi:MAG: hypothetical protein JSS69_18920 [Acidobacteria bacterium]|nr:hypothetical protein [Acidobacteriota bacterium]